MSDCLSAMSSFVITVNYVSVRVLHNVVTACLLALSISDFCDTKSESKLSNRI